MKTPTKEQIEPFYQTHFVINIPVKVNWELIEKLKKQWED